MSENQMQPVDPNILTQPVDTYNATMSRRTSLFSLKSSSFKIPTTLPDQATTSFQLDTNVVDTEVSHLKADVVLVYHEKKPSENVLNTKIDATFITNKQRLVFLENLAEYGLEIEKVNADNNVVYLLIRTPFKILLDVAENLKIKLPIQVSL